MQSFLCIFLGEENESKKRNDINGFFVIII